MITRPKAPPLGFAKVHADAGLSRNHARGAATAVCQDVNGEFMGSSRVVILGINDVVTLEVIAFREALSMTEVLMLRNFIVASDSKQVATDIRGEMESMGI
uniref:RNase H type-1 domain-containing protein n=1 Tax=Hordeum vulgare subsp. vulgare TaxID=112509 RepID=A0A8I6Y6N3_HORVV